MNDILAFLADPAQRRELLANALTSTNRGVVAGTLGAPVDMVNTLLNLGKAGVGYAGHKMGLLSADQMPNIDDKPVGGSEWIGDKMQQMGLLSSYRNQAAEGIAGGLLGPAASAAVQARAPQIARGLLQVQENANRPMTMQDRRVLANGQRGAVVGKYVDVYHGTKAPFDPKQFGVGMAGSNTAHESANVPAMWTTRSPKVADMFVSRFVDDATPLGAYGPRGAGTSAIRTGSYVDGAAVMPMKAKLNNPKIITGSEAEKMIFGGGDWRSGGADFAQFARRAMEQGHDGVIIKANPRGSLEFRAEQYVLFDPKTQAKSSFSAD